MGSIKIPIETSARHIHISREDFEKLFGEGKELTFVKELSQPGVIRQSGDIEGTPGDAIKMRLWEMLIRKGLF